MNFRKVTAIFRPDRLEAVEEKLRNMNVPGVSVSKVKGYGEYANFYEADWMCDHVRIEVFIGKDRAEAIAEAIVDVANTGLDGDGIVAVLPVESVYHIRRKEKCNYEVCE